MHPRIRGIHPGCIPVRDDGHAPYSRRPPYGTMDTPNMQFVTPNPKLVLAWELAACGITRTVAAAAATTTTAAPVVADPDAWWAGKDAGSCVDPDYECKGHVSADDSKCKVLCLDATASYLGVRIVLPSGSGLLQRA